MFTKTFEPHMDAQVTWVPTYNKHHNTILFLFCETLLLRRCSHTRVHTHPYEHKCTVYPYEHLWRTELDRQISRLMKSHLKPNQLVLLLEHQVQSSWKVFFSSTMEAFILCFFLKKLVSGIWGSLPRTTAMSEFNKNSIWLLQQFIDPVIKGYIMSYRKWIKEQF